MSNVVNNPAGVHSIPAHSTPPHLGPQAPILQSLAPAKPNVATALSTNSIEGGILARRREIIQIVSSYETTNPERGNQEIANCEAEAIPDINKAITLVQQLIDHDKPLHRAFRFLHLKHFSFRGKPLVQHNNWDHEPYPEVAGVIAQIARGVELTRELFEQIPANAPGELGRFRGAVAKILAHKEVVPFLKAAALRSEVAQEINLYALGISDNGIKSFEERENSWYCVDAIKARSALRKLSSPTETLQAARQEFQALCSQHKNIWQPNLNGNVSGQFLRQFVGHLIHAAKPALRSSLAAAAQVVAGTSRFADISTDSSLVFNRLLPRHTNAKDEPISLKLEAGRPLFIVSAPGSGTSTTLTCIAQALTDHQNGYPVRAGECTAIPECSKVTLLKRPNDPRATQHGLLVSSLTELAALIPTLKKNDVVLLDGVPTGSAAADTKALAVTLWTDIAQKGAILIVGTHLSDAAEIAAKETGGTVAHIERSVFPGDAKQYERIVKSGAWEGSVLLPHMQTRTPLRERALELFQAKYPRIDPSMPIKENTSDATDNYAEERLLQEIDTNRAYQLFTLALGKFSPECFAFSDTRLRIASSLSGHIFFGESIHWIELARGLGRLDYEKPYGFHDPEDQGRRLSNVISESDEDQLNSDNENESAHRAPQEREPDVQQRIRVTQILIKKGELSLKDLTALLKSLPDIATIKTAAKNRKQSSEEQSEEKDQLESLRISANQISALAPLYAELFPDEVRSYNPITAFCAALESYCVDPEQEKLSTLISSSRSRPLEYAITKLDTYIGLARSTIQRGAHFGTLVDEPHVLEVSDYSPTILEKRPALGLKDLEVPTVSVVQNPVKQTFSLKKSERGMVLCAPNSSGKSALMDSLSLDLIMLRNGYAVDGKIKVTKFDDLYGYFGVAEHAGTEKAVEAFSRIAARAQLDRGNHIVMLDELPVSGDPALASIQRAVIELSAGKPGMLILNSNEREEVKAAADKARLGIWRIGADVDATSQTVRPNYQITRDPELTSESLGIEAAAGVLSVDQVSRARRLRQFFSKQ